VTDSAGNMHGDAARDSSKSARGNTAQLAEHALIAWLVTSYWTTHSWHDDEDVRGWIPKHVVE
jgi:hypothetical protein